MIFTYQIEGMHCASCIDKIQSFLSAHYTIKSITLNPPSLEIEANKPPSLKELNAAILMAGKYRLLSLVKNNAVKDSANIEIASQNTLQTYYPLFLIILYIFGGYFLGLIGTSYINGYNLLKTIVVSSFFYAF